MELLIILAYTSVCIAAFTLLRIPLNRVSVPVAALGGVLLSFALVQLLNFYHPYTDDSRQYLVARSIAPGVGEGSMQVPLTIEEPNLVAWFGENSRLRLGDGGSAEVAFDSIPGKVFRGRVRGVLPTPGEYRAEARGDVYDLPAMAGKPRIPVLIDITDPRFDIYQARLQGGSHARTAIYSADFGELALVRKTLLRMSAWLNFLSPVG